MRFMLVSMLLIVSVSSFSQFRNSGSIKVRKKFPDIYAEYLGKTGGVITKDELSSMFKLLTNVDKFVIVEFTVQFSTNGKSYKWNYEGNEMSEALVGKLIQLPEGTKIMFVNIIAEGPTGSRHELHPLEFEYRREDARMFRDTLDVGE